MTPHRALRQGAVLLLALAALLAVVLAPPSPIRLLLVSPFLVFGLGLALSSLLRIGVPLLELALAPALGICAEAALATMTVYLGIWSPELVLVLCTAVALSALGADAWLVARVAHERPAA